MNELKQAERRLSEGLSVLTARPDAPKRISSPEFTECLMSLMHLVLEENEKINLTAITEPLEFVELHLLDSLACVGLGGITEALSIADIGTGAGFPGLPLALAYPEKQFLLADSLGKRIAFIEKAIDILGVKNVTPVHIRAEQLGRKAGFRESFDLVLSRAAGGFAAVLEYTLPLLKIGGELYAYKTIAKKSELDETLLARKMLGGAGEAEVFTYRDLLPTRGHAIFMVEKERPTPNTYPRRPGLPAKVPL